jgi:hypothetical protein
MNLKAKQRSDSGDPSGPILAELLIKVRFALITVATLVSIPSFAMGRPTSRAVESPSDPALECFEIRESTVVSYRGNLSHCRKDVVIPNSITEIGEYALSYAGLTSVVIPNSVTKIGSHAFWSNQLTSIVIPNSVTEIGSFAFWNNQLNSIEIPNSVTEIGECAFWSNRLTSVRISAYVREIGPHAFTDNELRSVNIPSTLTRIGERAFDSDVEIRVHGQLQ